MSALDEADQGLAPGFNNVMGQLAGLLAIVVLPAAAGLSGVAFSDPRFAIGYCRAPSRNHGARTCLHPYRRLDTRRATRFIWINRDLVS
jgi:hypothetical protein